MCSENQLHMSVNLIASDPTPVRGTRKGSSKTWKTVSSCETTYPAWASIMCITPWMGIFSPEPPRQKIGGQFPRQHPAGRGTKHWHMLCWDPEGSSWGSLLSPSRPPEDYNMVICHLASWRQSEGCCSVPCPLLPVVCDAGLVPSSGAAALFHLLAMPIGAGPSPFVCSGSPWNTNDFRTFCILLSPCNLHHLVPQPELLPALASLSPAAHHSITHSHLQRCF